MNLNTDLHRLWMQYGIEKILKQLGAIMKSHPDMSRMVSAGEKLEELAETIFEDTRREIRRDLPKKLTKAKFQRMERIIGEDPEDYLVGLRLRSGRTVLYKLPAAMIEKISGMVRNGFELHNMKQFLKDDGYEFFATAHSDLRSEGVQWVIDEDQDGNATIFKI